MLDGTYLQLWLIWGGLFVAIEGKALMNNKRGDTLSEVVWRFLGVKGYSLPSGYKWRRTALGAFFLWLMAHFAGLI